MERKNKYTKGIAAHCFNKCTKTITAYELRHWATAIKDPQTVKGTHLKGRAWDCDVDFGAALPSIVGNRHLRFSKKLATPVGRFTNDDVVAWRGDDQIHVGKILIFVEDALSELHFAYLMMYRLVNDTKWSSENAKPTPVSSSRFLANLLWYT